MLLERCNRLRSETEEREKIKKRVELYQFEQRAVQVEEHSFRICNNYFFKGVQTIPLERSVYCSVVNNNFTRCRDSSNTLSKEKNVCLQVTFVDIWRIIAEFSDFETNLRLGETCRTLAGICYDNRFWIQQIPRWKLNVESSMSVKENIWNDLLELKDASNMRIAFINANKVSDIVKKGYSGSIGLTLIYLLQFLTIPMLTMFLLYTYMFPKIDPINVSLGLMLILSTITLLLQINCGKRPFYLSHILYAKRFGFDIANNNITNSFLARWYLVNADRTIAQTMHSWDWIFFGCSQCLYSSFCLGIPISIIMIFQTVLLLYPSLLLIIDYTKNTSILEYHHRGVNVHFI